MNPQVGIMQGRLSPQFEGRFQAFPADSWRDEFARAAEAGLACIEWIYEKPHEADNPVGSDAGLAEIERLARATGVQVRSICADYYMTEHLVDAECRALKENVRHLRWLIGRASKLGAAYIVLPFVDASSMRNAAQRAAVAETIREVLPDAERARVELHVECDLPPAEFRAFLDGIGHPSVRANFDIGNSASLGYDPREELGEIGSLVGSVHVKDRRLHGSTVPLGSGHADFPTCFRKLKSAGFPRWLILQAARGEAGGEVALARANREFVAARWAGAG